MYLFTPNLIPSVETQLMFNEATQKNYEISYDEYYTERRLKSDMIVQVDIRSGQQVSSPKYLSCAHQTQYRLSGPKKIIILFHLTNLIFEKKLVEIDGQRNPKESLLINYEEKDYIEEYNDSKLFFKEYIGDHLLKPFISYQDLKTKYLIGLIDLRHQLDHTTPKQLQVFQEYSADSNNATMLLLLIRRREIELISDGIKLIEVRVV